MNQELDNETSSEIFTLLIVDDNKEILDLLSDLLKKKHHVLLAENVNEAQLLLAQNIVHLIISDIMMPGIDGLEFCQMIKSDIEMSHIPVVLLTAKNTLQAKVDGLDVGADAYIEKPFSPTFLNAQVSNLLNNRKRLKDYFAKSPLAHINTMAQNVTDEKFLNDLQKAIETNFSNRMLDVEFLAERLNMSRPTLYRKIKSISNLSPNEMINITRLKKAAELIHKNSDSMEKIAFSVGFSSLTQFGRVFLKKFGVTPSGYLRKISKKQQE